MIRTYRDLLVWQRAMELSELAYVVTRRLPRYEQHGLADQIRRSAVSVAANIAEGHGRVHRGEFIHHLSFAAGSLAELETLLLSASRLHSTDVDRAMSFTAETGRMLCALIGKLRSPATPRPPSPVP
jgi:four helix bundle protein